MNERDSRPRQSSRKPSPNKDSSLSLNRPQRSSSSGRPFPLVLKNQTDHKILELLSRHRVATTQQIAEILGVPERTARYRLAKLRRLYLVSFERPYSARGRSPNYYFPTRYGDAIARGTPLPRGGARKDPSVFFLRHTAGITELYCAILRLAKTDEFEVVSFLRETEARETFRYSGQSTAIVPDVSFILNKGEVEYHGFIELDLGTMSSPRLTKKLGLYASYVRSVGWEGQHPYCPTLLFITTTTDRVERILKIFSSKCRWEERRAARYLESDRLGQMILGACDVAARPQDAILHPVWATMDQGSGLSLKALLHPPYEKWSESQSVLGALQDQKERATDRLTTDPEARRAQIHSRDSTLPFAQLLESSGLNAEGKQAMRNLLSETGAMSREEEEAFSFFERRLLDKSGEQLWEVESLPITPDEKSAIESLIDTTLRSQRLSVAAIYGRHPESPTLRRAIHSLDQKVLLDARVIDHLDEHIRSDVAKLARQQDLKPAYFAWRKWAVGRHRVAEGRRGKLVRKAAEEATNADLAMIHYCKGCEELVVPVIEKESYLHAAQCSFCGSTKVSRIREWVGKGVVAPDGEGFWKVNRRPTPPWVHELASESLRGKDEAKELKLPEDSKFRIYLREGRVARHEHEDEEDGYVPREDFEETWADQEGED